MIGEQERRKMLRAHSIGPRMIAYFEQIGIEKLADFVGADAEEVAKRINAALRRKHLNRLGVDAIRNVIALAEAEARPPR